MSDSANSDWEATAQTLVALGAPLTGWKANQVLSPDLAFLNGLEFAKENATVLRALPLVLARQWRRFDWARLEQAARERGLLALLGMVSELTAALADLPELARWAQKFWEPASKPRHLFGVRNEFERELAEVRSPAVARKWGFLMNMGEDSFRALYERHAHQV